MKLFWWIPIPELETGTRQRLVWVLAAILLLILSRLTWQPLFQGPVVDFIDVGQGDATFIRTEAGQTLLIDGGDRTPFMDYGRAVVTPFLLGHGVSHLDYVIITHFDSDHMGGLFHVTEQIGVGEILLPYYPSVKSLESEFIAHARTLDIPMRRIARGDDILLAGADSIEVLHPPATGWETRSDNEQSLVFRLRWRGLDILLPGDAEQNAEAAVARLDCQAEILKAGHHGSHTSTSAPFLEVVDPRYVVVSTRSSPNRHGVHPSVRQRIEARGIPIWRTDFHGGIRIRPQGEGHEIQGARHERGYSLDPERLSPSRLVVSPASS